MFAQLSTSNQHWALTSGELVSWTGSWHNGFDPPATVEENTIDLSLPQPSTAIPSILVVDLMSVGQHDGQTLIVSLDGTTYQLQTGAGCPSALQEVGRRV